MKFVDKIVELPKISIRDLEKRVRSTHSPLSAPLSSITSHLAHIAAKSQAVVDELKVTSPFYHRHEMEGSKCQCLYHRMKRAKGSLSKLRCKNVDSSFNVLQGCEIKQEDADLNELSRAASCVIQQQNFLILEQVNRRSWGRFAQKGLNLQKNLITKQNRKDIDLSLLPQGSRERSHWDWKLGEVNPKVDISNDNYLHIINNRHCNDKFKSKYLKMLFGFIKMKANQDKLYLYQSKPYLKNSLNVLLNHFTLDQLRHQECLAEDELEKVAYFMACKKQKVPAILKDLSKAVNQMEEYLNLLRQAQHQKEARDLNPLEESIISASNPQEQNQKGDRQARNSLIGSINLLHHKGQHQVQKPQNPFGSDHRLSTNKIFPMRKSHRPQEVQVSSNSNKEADNTQNTEQTEQDREIKVQPHINAGRQFRKTQTARSTISVGNGPNELGKARESKFGEPGKNKSNLKPRKAQFHQKLVCWNSFDKYKDIKYQDYCSKQEFSTLVEEIERLDRNDEERAFAAFNKLKVYKMIDSPTRIHALLEDFRPLIHDAIREHLVKHVVMVRDQRYIEKLMTELDQAISDVKRTDPRTLDSEEIFPYKGDPTLKQPHHLRNIQYRGHNSDQEHQTDKIIYYEAEEKVVRHLTRENNQRKELQQSALSEIKNEDIHQDYTYSVDHRPPLRQKQVVVKQIGLERDQQKKILQYMRQHYPNTFHYLNDSISDVCSNLPQEAHLPII